MISEQFNVMLCGHTSVMELWLLAMQCLSHLGNKGYTEVRIYYCIALNHGDRELSQLYGKFLVYH